MELRPMGRLVRSRWIQENSNFRRIFNASLLLGGAVIKARMYAVICDGSLRWFQCCIIVYWTLVNKLQWNSNQNSNICIQENAFENVVWKMSAIVSPPQCLLTTNTYLSLNLAVKFCEASSIPFSSLSHHCNQGNKQSSFTYTVSVSKIRKNIYRSDMSFTVITDIYKSFIPNKLHLLSTVLLSGFQSSRRALKSTR